MRANKLRSTARRCLAGIASAAVIAGIAQIAAAEPSPAIQNIDINKFVYEPAEVTVSPGTKVVWTNRDETPHTVTSRDRTFASKGLDTDDRYENTFAREGDFAYFCTVHPHMNGIVHVRSP